MLLTLMSNLGMFGITPIPTIPTKGGAGHKVYDDAELRARRLKKRLLQEDDEILIIIKTFVQCQY